MSVFGAVPHAAHAQTIDPATKLAPGLETDVQAYGATGDGSAFGE